MNPAQERSYGAHAFKPQVLAGTDGLANSITVAGTTSATSGALPTRDPGYNMVRVANQSTGWTYINFGDASLVAATVANSLPVAPGSIEVFSLDPWMTSVSVINAVAGNVIFTLGQGV